MLDPNPFKMDSDPKPCYKAKLLPRKKLKFQGRNYEQLKETMIPVFRDQSENEENL